MKTQSMRKLIESIKLDEAVQVDSNMLLSQLEDLRYEIVEAIQNADKLLRGNRHYNSASGYWIAHIKSALGDMGYSTHATTMQDTIDSIREETEDEADEDGYLPNGRHIDDDGSGLSGLNRRR